jgi:hypothetical protein
MIPTISKYKSARYSLVRELILETSMDKYWSDKDFRLAINEKNKARARVKLCCADSKKTMSHGSMLPHKKICKGVSRTDSA